jgi:hypothetical protein
MPGRISMRPEKTRARPANRRQHRALADAVRAGQADDFAGLRRARSRAAGGRLLPAGHQTLGTQQGVHRKPLSKRCTRVVEQAEQIAGLRRAANGVGQHHGRHAALAGEPLARPFLLVGRAQDHPGRRRLLTCKQRVEVAAGRLDTRLRFERADFGHAQPARQIDEGLVMDEDRHPLSGTSLLFPARHGGLPFAGEGGEAGLVGGGIGGIEFGHAPGQRLADLQHIARIEMGVRIASRDARRRGRGRPWSAHRGD